MENEPGSLETQPRSRKNKLYVGLAIVLAAAVFVGGYFAGGGKVVVSSGNISITKGNVPSGAADYSLLWDALDTLNSKFVDRPLDQQKLLYGAVAGLVSAAGDPYTAFFDPEQASSFAEQLRGSFEGIGAEVAIKDDQIVIVAPLPDTPAARAGIQAGDAILAINGESTQGMTVDVAVAKIRGDAGTSVTLSVRHAGAKTAQDISIQRDKIEIKSVNLSTKEVSGKKIAVIKINQFGDDTKGLLDQAVSQVAAGGFAGVILDLRDNPGGYLDTAVSTVSNWIDPDMLVVKEKGYGDMEKNYNSSGVPRLKGMPTVVLVNGGSASASEIVSGALQDYGAATLVGEKTFGKGSVQELLNLKDNTEIKVTVAKWYTPKDRGINGTGLQPDITVGLTADNVQNQQDPQMDKALDLLK